MPLIYYALESDNPVVLEKALRAVPDLCESLDYTVRLSSPASTGGTRPRKKAD